MKKAMFFSLLLPALIGVSMISTDNTRKSGLDLKAMDPSKSPAEDFFLYANGNWMKNNPIPSTEASWGAFNELAEKNRTLLKTILDECAAKTNAPKGSVSQLVGDYYGSAMDTVAIEKVGLTPMKKDLELIQNLKTASEIPALLGLFHLRGYGLLFGVGIYPDLKNSSEYITYISQGGLGLPDRDYYLKEDEKSVALRKDYVTFVNSMMNLAEQKNKNNEMAAVVMKIETALAKASMTNVELRDDEKQYNKFSFSDISMKYPKLGMNQYFAALGISDRNNIIITQPAFFKEVENLFQTVTIQEWKTYLSWSLINTNAVILNKSMEQANFAFFGTRLNGVKEMKPRWKRMVASTNSGLGEAVGQLYVEKAFSAESKKRVNAMVDNLLAVYKTRIEGLDWMSPETKKKALVKLSTFKRKLGYPDKWKDYAGVNITRTSYYDNVAEVSRYEMKRMIDKLGKPVDRDEWHMMPQVVNASYNPLNNDICFPAAIMQIPFFNADADDAVNYGAMGSVIGHEVTHGFDDQGSKYDDKGNLNDWWTETDRKKFDEKTSRLVKQFSDIKVFDDLNVNGELTLGENIADLGGLTMSMEAYKLTASYKENKTIDGFTPMQRFFLGWAQAWRTSYRDESLRNQVLTNVHAPGHIRARVPLTNLDEFYRAFNIQKPTTEKVVVW